MPLYDGNNWEVRIATTQAGLLDATIIPYVKNWSEDRNPGIKQVAKGMGKGRGKEVHETLTELTGNLEKTYCDTLLAVESPFSSVNSPFGEIATMEDVAWWLEFKNKISGKKIQFGGVHGKYNHPHVEDDFGTETWDWAAESRTMA